MHGLMSYVKSGVNIPIKHEFYLLFNFSVIFFFTYHNHANYLLFIPFNILFICHYPSVLSPSISIAIHYVIKGYCLISFTSM